MNDEFLKRISSLSQKQLTLLAAQLQAKLNKAENERHEPVAIIGMGCRLPGGNDPDSFWRTVNAGANCARPVGTDRWNMEAYYDSNPTADGKMYVRNASLLDNADRIRCRIFRRPEDRGREHGPAAPAPHGGCVGGRGKRRVCSAELVGLANSGFRWKS